MSVKPQGISACLIVKNEADVLGRCLSSLSGRVDEVVVADTGSSDGTPDIARKAGAYVLLLEERHPFHFGDARQAALSAAGFLWTLSIDADEILLPAGAEILRRATSDMKIHVWDVGFLQKVRPDSEPVKEYLRRFFRSDLCAWRFRVHEQVVATRSWVKAGTIREAVLEHLPKKDHEARNDQNFELLKLAVAEDKDFPHLHFYLAHGYWSRKDFPPALVEIDRYLAFGAVEGQYWFSEGHLLKGFILDGMDLKDDALKALEASHQACQARREPLILASEIALGRGRLGMAVWYLERALAIPKEKMPDFHLNWPSAWGRIPQETLARILGQLDAADPGFWARLPPDDAKRLKRFLTAKEAR